MGDWISNVPTATANFSNGTATSIDLPKTVSLILIFACSLLGNVCTVAIVSSFKQRKLPDVLVIGLACTDLIATLIPVPMSLYSYVTLKQFSEGTLACNFYGTVAQFTRYASVLIVTLISLERYFAVNQPFIYRKYATPRKCVGVLLFCWILAFLLALAPVLDRRTTIVSHDGFCLFDFSSKYAISILIYAGAQYCIVLVCFVLVTAKLLRVYRRRKQLQVQGKYNQRSQAMARNQESRPKLTSRISDIGIALKKAAPILTERFQLGVEAQFARMLFAVVALFYVSWTTLVILIALAQAKGTQGGQSLSLFWGIRLSVISLALNPLLYGLLARQYRMAYVYVLRRMFSSCCTRCIDPPVNNIFVTARTSGGEPQGEKRKKVQNLGQNYGSQGNILLNGSFQRGKADITHTTHLSLDLLPQLDEDYSLGQDKPFHQHCTYIPSAGDLSSTVVIPHDKCKTGTLVAGNCHLGALSDHVVAEVCVYEHPAVENNPGSHNPLAVVADTQGESAVTKYAKPQKLFPPLEVIDPYELNAGKVYNNPTYTVMKDTSKLEMIPNSAPLSLLRSSQKVTLTTCKPFARETNAKAQIFTSVQFPQRLQPTKIQLVKAKSIPVVHKTTTHTLPLSTDSFEEEVTTLTDGVMDSSRLNSSDTEFSGTNSNHYPIEQVLESPGATEKADDIDNDSTPNFTPRYQLSVSPVSPLSLSASSELPYVPPYSGSKDSSDDVSTLNLPYSPAAHSTELTHENSMSPTSTDDSGEVKCSVKDLRERFEILSSAPPS